MKYLEKTWVRVIISLIGGGMVTEIIHISTGDPNRPMTANFSLLFAIIIYVLMTFIMTLIKNRSL
jgi:hypothetical protein